MGNHDCTYFGRLIAGKIATAHEGLSWATFEPLWLTSSLGRRFRPTGYPFRLSVSHYAPPEPARQASAAATARRTPVGRTVISGQATEDVTSVTLHSPRDVRTIKPGPSGLLLAVYDGILYGGHIKAIIHLRNGRDHIKILRVIDETEP